MDEANLRCSLNAGGAPMSTCRRQGLIVDVVTHQPGPPAARRDPEQEEDTMTNISPLTTSLATTMATSSEEEDDDAIAAATIMTAAPRTRSASNGTRQGEGGQSIITRRTRKSPRQASETRINEKQAKESFNQRYSLAFKEATFLLSSECTSLKKGNKNLTTEKILEQLNEKYQLNGTKKKLTKSTVYRAVARGDVGMTSPMKRGPRTKIPDALLEVVAVHTEMCQVGDEGELRGRDIKRIIGAAVLGTQFHDKFKVQSVWKKVRCEFPEKLQAARKLSVDDARAQWTTYNNLQQWFDDAKRDLIDTGLVIDQEVRDRNGNLISELDFRSNEVRRRIINMDETHHDLSITGDRGGPRSVMYHNPNFQRGSRRGVKASRHVTGVYATNTAGESLPPMYIFDSCAKIDDNFRVRMQWLDGRLPTITGRFGCPTRIESSSFYSVRARGSMDDSLLNDYIDKVLLPLYPNIAKEAAFDAVTGKLLPPPCCIHLRHC